MDEGYARVVSLSQQYACWGYRKIQDLMKAEGLWISRERVRRNFRREGLQVVRKRGNAMCWEPRHSGCTGLLPEPCVGYDFVFDQTEDGRQLNVNRSSEQITQYLFSRTGIPPEPAVQDQVAYDRVAAWHVIP